MTLCPLGDGRRPPLLARLIALSWGGRPDVYVLRLAGFALMGFGINTKTSKRSR